MSPSLSTRSGFPAKRSMSPLIMTVVGEVVLRWLIFIVRTARGVAVLGEGQAHHHG